MTLIPAYWTSALANHLWQSTVSIAVAWLLALALRNNQARTRYWIWLIASLKFLVPFALLIEAGKRIGSISASPLTQPVLSSATLSSVTLSSVIAQIAQPFPQSARAAIAAPASILHFGNLLPILLLAAWVIGTLAVASAWLRRWLQIRAAVQTATRRALAVNIPMLSTPSLLEPGVFGILQPVLLLPDGIMDRLTQPQLETIVAHEMCHVRRRDNLTFALHMVVETLFWFHPLVWWIRARLIEERERACDEAVLQSGSEAQVYAEGILNVCKFYVESPLACISGVTGSDLKKRIVRIMTGHQTRKLDFTRKLLLSIAALAIIAVPVAFGLANATPARAGSQAEDPAAKLPAYDVVSIKPHKPDDHMVRIGYSPDGFTAINVTLQMLVRQAYEVEDDQIAGLPKGSDAERYDMEAKVDSSVAGTLDKLSPHQRPQMLRSILEDRFKLNLHHETKELPIFALVVTKNGLKLHEAKPGDDYANGFKGPEGRNGAGMMLMQPGKFTGQGVPIENLVEILSQQRLGRTIVDKTGLTGKYDFVLQWSPDHELAPTPGGGSGDAGAPPADASGPSLFTALQEQLGLKLESQKGPVEMIVIDHIEKPSAN